MTLSQRQDSEDSSSFLSQREVHELREFISQLRLERDAVPPGGLPGLKKWAGAIFWFQLVSVTAQLKGSVSGGNNGGAIVEVTHVRGALPALSRGRCRPGLQVRNLRPRETSYLA